MSLENMMMDQLEERFKIFSITQMVSATLSILGSATLLFMISRSQEKLQTTLHRLLLGLCISDLISSVAMSFASTLSPPDHIFGWNTVGNMSLCRIQGFLQFFGHIAAPLYNSSLCIYYLIEIKFTDLREHIILIEVCMHAASILIALALTVTIVLLKGIHPEVTHCYAGATYPFECRFNPDVECQETMTDHMTFTVTYMLLQFVFVPLTIFGSMTMIYREVASQEVRMNQYRFSFTMRGSTSAQRNTIAARNRATAYSMAWLLSWATTFVIILKNFLTGEINSPFWMGLTHSILFPLQGLFNFIVYLSPKMTGRMRYHERQDVAHPWRFMLSFRDVMGRGNLTGLPRHPPYRSRTRQNGLSTQNNNLQNDEEGR